MATEASDIDAAILRRALLSKDEILLNQLLDQDIYDSQTVETTVHHLKPEDAAELVNILTHRVFREYATSPKFVGWLRATLLRFRKNETFLQKAEPALRALRAFADSKQLSFSVAVQMQLRVSQLAGDMKLHLQRTALAKARDKAVAHLGNRNQKALVTLKVLKKPPTPPVTRKITASK